MTLHDDALMQTIAILGAGRVARGLGARLREAGWRIGAVVARQMPAARAAVRAIRGGTPSILPTRRMLDAGIILLAVPDDALAAVTAILESIGGDELRRKVVVHTSGALTSEVLKPLALRGAWTGVMHPMQSFGARTRPRLDGVLFGIEGHNEALRVIRRMVRSLGGHAARVEAARKAEYHCAGTFAAAHLLASVEAGIQMLVAGGMKRREATSALLRLARQVLDNQELLGPRAAWTGPLSRGDMSTVALHWQALSRYPAEFRTAYAAMTRLAARLLAASPEEMLARLETALASGSVPQQRAAGGA